MNKKLSGTLVGGLFVLASVTATASVTAQWGVDSYKSFDKGEANSAFISSLGEVRPGWSHASTDLEFDTAWSSVQDKDGTVYIGSDDKATIYKVKGETVSKLASLGKAVAVVSLVLDGDTLYAGTMPDGEVWRIDAKSGDAKKLASLDKSETVWSLALAGGSIYAGTGPEGLLYKVDSKSGKATLAFDSEDKRIMSMLATGDDALWFGTSDNALLFRHDLKTNKTRAVADFAGNEISALAEWRGNVIAAANDLAPTKSTGTKTKEAVDKAAKKKDAGQVAKMPKDGSKPGADAAVSADVAPEAKSLRKGKGALYRVRGDGQLTQLHALTSSYFTSIAVNKDGQIFAGAADNGRIYMVDPDDSVSTAIDVSQRYIAQLFVDSEDRIGFVTGDSANLYRPTGRAKDASYNSEVFDAKVPARFGGLVWHAAGTLTIETRTGNTEEPGVGWSEWQAPSQSIRGVGNISRAKVQSPPGRYFQYRAKFGSDDAVLRQTQLFYLPSNQPTRLTEVEIEPSDKSSGLVTLSAQAAKPRSPVLKISWSVENGDGDNTAYELEVRREGDVNWRPIRTGEKTLTKTEFEWNTETFPDGYYRLRVNASDRLENTRSRALESSFTTPLFVVDNERPKLAGLSVRYPSASARVTDAMSTIAEMSYSIDDGPWRVGGTQDGIFDDQSELLEIDLPAGLSAGAHTLAIRAADSAGNVGSSTLSFKVP